MAFLSSFSSPSRSPLHPLCRDPHAGERQQRSQPPSRSPSQQLPQLSPRRSRSTAADVSSSQAARRAGGVSGDTAALISVQTSYVAPYDRLSQTFSFLSDIWDLPSFDAAVFKYFNSSSYSSSKFGNNQLGCSGAASTGATIRWQRTALCSRLVNHADSVNCASENTGQTLASQQVACQDTCNQYSDSEKEIVVNTTLCPGGRGNKADTTINADLQYCLGGNSSSSGHIAPTGTCVEGVDNEDACGWGSSTSQLCTYCKGNKESCCGSVDLSTLCGFESSAQPSSSGGSSPGSGNSSSGSKKKGISGGAIAGIVIGVLAGVVIVSEGVSVLTPGRAGSLVPLLPRQAFQQGHACAHVGKARAWDYGWDGIGRSHERCVCHPVVHPAYCLAAQWWPWCGSRCGSGCGGCGCRWCSCLGSPQPLCYSPCGWRCQHAWCERQRTCHTQQDRPRDCHPCHSPHPWPPRRRGCCRRWRRRCWRSCPGAPQPP